ncbi:COPII coat GTPase [Gurleya vavrai]
MDKISDFYTRIKDKLLQIYEKTLSQFIRSIFPQNVSILFLGIDNAGKTTLLNLLKESTQATKPTSHPTSTEVQIGNMHANVCDLGGHEAARLIWERFFYKCNGVVFIVDANDEERFLKVKEAYESVIGSIRKVKKNGVPINVLINKMDKVYLKCNNNVKDIEDYVEKMMEIVNIKEEQDVKVTFVSMTKDSVTQKHDKGIYDSFLWLDNVITMAKEKGEL